MYPPQLAGYIQTRSWPFATHSILPESYRFREINVEHTGAISEPNLESPLAVSLYTWLCATHAQLARSVSSRTWLGW